MTYWVVFYEDSWEHFITLKSVWRTEAEAKIEVEILYQEEKAGQHPDYRPVRHDYQPVESKL
jgi:hypothetical protein